MKTAFIFPGQGAQKVGMGKDLYDGFPVAREIFAQAEEACKLPLAKLCFEGPEDQLARTDVCQVAIFTVSAATLAVMQEVLGEAKMPKPDFMAGLSLGEYTALYAAGAMDLASAARLLTRRGQAMQAASTAAASGMLCVLGPDEAKINELCAAAADGQVLTAANFNCPGQVVISGHKEACERAANLAKDFGATGTVALAVAGAFHSPLMAPAAAELAQTLETVMFSEPRVPVLANTDALAYGCTCRIKPTLLAQLVNPVRWQQCMESLLGQGVTKFYEIGPNRVLAGLMRRINRKTEVVCVNSLQAIEDLAK